MELFSIDYSPLKQTLHKKGKRLGDLELSSRTIAKINKNESMTLNTVGKICVLLGVGMEEVVTLKFD